MCRLGNCSVISIVGFQYKYFKSPNAGCTSEQIALQRYKKQRYTVTVAGKVQEVGFRGYVEEICRNLRIPYFAYNVADELRLICEADEETLTRLSRRIKDYKLGRVRSVKVAEGVQVPYPGLRGVTDIEHEISNRLDEGVRVLHSIKDDTKNLAGIDGNIKKMGGVLHSIKDDTKNLAGIDGNIKKMDNKLDSMDKHLGGIGRTLKQISKKL